MRASVIVGLVVVVAAVVAAVQYDTIESWFASDKAGQGSTTAPVAIGSQPAAPENKTTTASEKSTETANASKPAEKITATDNGGASPSTTSKPAAPTQGEATVTSAARQPSLANANSDANTASDPEESSSAKPPSFDVVRVNPKGDAVIAGRAEPGAEVTVKDAEDVIGKVTADKRGEWVLVPEKPLPSGARQLSLQEKTAAGEVNNSKDVVVLFVPEKTHKADGKQEEVVAVLSPREGQGGSRILQAPSAPTGTAGNDPARNDKDLTLKIIDYDEQGRVVLSGKAPPGSEVRAMVDEKTVGTTKADKAGDWQISPPKPVVSGQHAIRIEQVGKSGIVQARLSVPFSRATVRPGTLAPGTVVIEPGNSLWRIARATYGEGTKYTLIFAANSEQIGNPNVIYPGQIFVLPPADASN